MARGHHEAERLRYRLITQHYEDRREEVGLVTRAKPPPTIFRTRIKPEGDKTINFLLEEPFTYELDNAYAMRGSGGGTRLFFERQRRFREDVLKVLFLRFPVTQFLVLDWVKSIEDPARSGDYFLINQVWPNLYSPFFVPRKK